MTTRAEMVWFNATHWCGIIGHGVVFMDTGWDEIGVHLSVVGD